MSKTKNKKNYQKIIDGKAMAESIKDEVVKEIEELCVASKIMGPRPSLAIILVGDREDSKLYVSLKEREAKRVGIDTHLYKCEADITEREIFDMIEFLNKDESVDAILVQLPLPEGFDTDGIIATINPNKDVDCFHPDNIEKIFKSKDEKIMLSPVYGTVLHMLDSTKLDYAGKNALVVGNSEIFMSGLVRLLSKRGLIAESVKEDDASLNKKTLSADVLITAVGKSRLIKKEMVKEGATIVDIGISKESEKITGDVDFENVKEVASFITPVPGGVGPMTIAILFRNVVELYRRRKKK